MKTHRALQREEQLQAEIGRLDNEVKRLRDALVVLTSGSSRDFGARDGVGGDVMISLVRYARKVLYGDK